MKAEVIRWNNSLDRYTIKIINGISYGRMSKEKAQEIAGKLNSALASHVQSELSKTNAGYWKDKLLKIRNDLYDTLPTGTLHPTNDLVWNMIKDIQIHLTNIDVLLGEPTPPPSTILSTKIAEIEKTFTDRKVRPLDPVWVKNEILKILKGE